MEVFFKEFSELARKKNGKLLSQRFYGFTKYHDWYCNKHNFIWKSKPSNMRDYPSKKGTWCPKCAIESLPQNNFKYTIEDMQKLAKLKPGGGQCLSKEYKGMLSYHTWKCGTCGHIWKARPIDIRGKPTRPEGNWCPQCAEGRRERIVRTFFEEMFCMKFPKENELDWLKRYNLHLDGYNKKLKLAFECQGIQHYRYHEYFHKGDPNKFKKRLRLDEYKRKNCKNNGIVLIEIGYELRNGKLHKIRITEMEEYIRKKSIEAGINPPGRSYKLDWRNFDIFLPDELKELQKLAEIRNGKLLSSTYLGETVDLHWYCNKHEHDWWAKPCDIRGKPSKPKGTWCPKCGREKLSKIKKEQVKQRARDKNGRFF